MTDEQRARWDRLAKFSRNPNTVPHGEIEIPASLVVAADDQIRLFARQVEELIKDRDELLHALGVLLGEVGDEFGEPEEDDGGGLAVAFRRAKGVHEWVAYRELTS